MSEARNTRGIARWRRQRRIARDARILLKETRRILRKHRHRLKERVLSEVSDVASALAAARRERDYDGARDRLEQLDKLLDKHLAFARKSAFREYSESIGIALLIALLLRAFVVEAFKIPSGSMIPTLKVGDHIFVNKFIYGLRIPYTHVKFIARTPRRGEVIVFIYPRDPSKDFIKRVVALGGDTIEVRDDLIYLNGKPVRRRRLPGPCTYVDQEEGSDRWALRRCVAYAEELDGTFYRVIQDEDELPPPDLPPFKVPEGSVFVMGDNRYNSSDSRVWHEVPEGNIKGKALIIWWSRGVPDGVRWSRFFTLVHGSDGLPQAFVGPQPLGWRSGAFDCGRFSPAGTFRVQTLAGTPGFWPAFPFPLCSRQSELLWALSRAMPQQLATLAGSRGFQAR